MSKNVFFRAKSKKLVQKHMITPAIWSGPALPEANDVLYPGLSSATEWINLDIKDIEQHCVDNDLICFYGKGELLFIKKEEK